MKKIILFVVILVGLNSMSYGQVNDSIKSEQLKYMTIISEFHGSQLYLIYITQPDGKFEKLKWDDTKKYRLGDTTVLIDLLSKYSNQGWTVENNNMTVDNGNYYFYYLLKRRIFGPI